MPKEMSTGMHRAMAIHMVSKNYAIERIPPQIMHAILGLASESGELIDALKRAIFYDLELDLVNCDEKVGDKLFYIQLYALARGKTIEQLMAQNEAKLRKRYPEGTWSKSQALNRDLDAERTALETSGD